MLKEDSMKKICLLWVMMALSLSACGGKVRESRAESSMAMETTAAEIKRAAESTEAAKEEGRMLSLSEDINDFQIEIEGTVFRLPVRYSELTAAGWTAKEGEDTERIRAHSKAGIFSFQKGKYKLMAYAVNFDINEQPVTNCYISDIIIDDFLDNKEISVRLPKGITMVKSGYDEVRAAYGDPKDEYKSDTLLSLTYSQNSDNSLQLFFDAKSGLLTKIDISNLEQPEDFVAGEVNTAVPQAVTNYQAPQAVSDNPTDFDVQFDGMMIHLPAPVSVFTGNGWEIKEDESEKTVMGSDAGWVTMYKNGHRIRSLCRNKSRDSAEIQNCFVTSLRSDDTDSRIPMTIFKGITTGISREDLEKALEGIEYKTEDSSTIQTYTVGKVFEEYEILVKKDSGIVYGITVSHDPK